MLTNEISKTVPRYRFQALRVGNGPNSKTVPRYDTVFKMVGSWDLGSLNLRCAAPARPPENPPARPSSTHHPSQTQKPKSVASTHEEQKFLPHGHGIVR